jgi:hypothetical protein
MVITDATALAAMVSNDLIFPSVLHRGGGGPACWGGGCCWCGGPRSWAWLRWRWSGPKWFRRASRWPRSGWWPLRPWRNSRRI